MVIHILRDGNQVTDISGKKVRQEDAPSIYALIQKMRKENEKSILRNDPAWTADGSGQCRSK